MGRQARQYSQSGLYHIVYRGINRQNIFEEENDYIKMRNVISELKQELGFEVYAYCFMSNHVHLLLKEAKTGDISIIMKRLLTKYAGWFNRKYERSGVLIANRYKSQPLENDEYLLSVVRYIHQNPQKANLVHTLSDYKWSSYPEYINKSILTDTHLILSMLDKMDFEKFHQDEEKELHEVSDRISKSEEYIRRRIVTIINGRHPHEIAVLPKGERNEIIKRLRKDEGFSIRQIERATGISRGIIARVNVCDK
ncbi:MAG: transposase [Syntrophomonadaceae bacterium]|nr:transposase [Syntrophomonadaceae bacterium]MDD3898272.1 transposase [Syntrophomonadaceae bacterium]